MGSTSFNACMVETDGAAQGVAFADDAGTTGPVIVSCYQDHTGRRPAGLAREPDVMSRSIGEVLARAAYLEGAAVEAFLDLAAQLSAHGAPRSLVARLRRAAADEVRHARVVGALARARGAEPPAVRVERTGPRSLFALALENAREGCVRETWGAASAVAQSKRARDRDVRDTMEAVARDELEHAALSWDLDAWLCARLAPGEHAAVEAARADAVREVEREIEEAMPDTWARALGVPSRAEARSMFAGMRAELWAA
jgi:rubrerythrin